jgi:hypothetical protein
MQESDSQGCQKGCQSHVSRVFSTDDAALLRRRHPNTWLDKGCALTAQCSTVGGGVPPPGCLDAGAERGGVPSGWRPRRGDTYLPLRNPGAFSMRGILDWALGGVLGWGCGFTGGAWRRFMGYWCHNMRVCLVAGL